MKKVILFILVLFFSGCSTAFGPKICNQEEIDAASMQRIQQNDRKIAKEFATKLTSNQLALVTTIMDVDRLDEENKTKTLGRFLTEDLITALSNSGVKVVEIKLRKKVLSESNSGEFALSHKLQNIAKRFRADVLITGTYSVGSKNIYINVKMVDLHDHSVRASQGYIVTIDNDLRKLLGLKLREPKRCEEF